MERLTHLEIAPRVSGELGELTPGKARLELSLSEEMRADARGLVHGGFVFSLADHAAMLAINHPHVVLGSAQVRFLRPVVVGDRLTAVAELRSREGKKQMVAVEVRRGEETVASGELVCFSPSRHVLER